MAVMGPGGMMKKLQTLEEQQETMENDMTTAKDMIWRLSNRINALEKEVKYLRTCVDTKDKESTNDRSVHNFVTERRSSRISETAKRRSYSEFQIVKREQDEIDDGGASDASILEFLSLSNIEGNYTVESKRRRRNSDSSFNPASDGENGDSHSGDEKIPKKQDGQEDVKSKATSSVWNNFYVQTLPNDLNLGKKQPKKIAICKFCKQQVSARHVRLKGHIDKCVLTVGKNSNEGTKHSSIEGTNSVPAVSEDGTSLVEHLDGTLVEHVDGTMVKHVVGTLSDASISDDEEIMDITTLEDLHKVGRRKSSVWKYFDKKTILETANGTEVKVTVAFCNKCGTRVSARRCRLVSHKKACDKVTT